MHFSNRFDSLRSVEASFRCKALIDCDGGVVGDFEEGDDALASCRLCL